MIKAINWIITGRCNGRCVHCDMWRAKGRRKDLSFKDVERILSDAAIEKAWAVDKEAVDVSFAGGEPFLRADLSRIVDLLEKKYPRAFKSITTNGLLSGKVVAFVERYAALNFKLIVSIDGLERVHDTLRGPGSFRKTVRTIIRVRREFPRQQVEIKLTLSPRNYDQILKVHALATDLGCRFSFKPAENLPSYTNACEPCDTAFHVDQRCIVRNQCFVLADLMYRQKDYRRARFYRDIPFYLAGIRRPRACSALEETLTIMPDGEGFFCLKEPGVGQVSEGAASRALPRKRNRYYRCPSCLLLCGPYKDYSGSPFEKVTANIETINRCNLDCAMCTQSGLRKEAGTQMSPAILHRVIESNPDITHVSFVGGEPFLNRHFFDMMHELDARGITYEITTNGTLIDKETVDRLKTCVGLAGILFSLDGLRSYHDRQRGQGVFDQCVGALKRMKDCFAVGVSSVFRDDNADELVRLTGFLGDMGVFDHRIVYGMSWKKEAAAHSVKARPGFVLSGPGFLGQETSLSRSRGFFQLLEKMAGEKNVRLNYVPDIFRKQTQIFLEETAVSAAGLHCRQLKQLRFDARGERIVCEFIRNPYDADIVGRLERKLLPVCAQCCKLTDRVPASTGRLRKELL